MTRKTFLRGIVIVAAGLAATIASAQSYPNRQIQFVIPFAAGGGSDVMARIIAEPLAQRLGRTPEEIAQQVRNEQVKWKKVIEPSGAKAE